MSVDHRQSENNNFQWRGFMYAKLINKVGLHSAVILRSKEFTDLTADSLEACKAAQLIVIEGSPEVDLLTTIHHWKSRGKKVVVDIPMSSEDKCRDTELLPSNGYRFVTSVLTNYNNDSDTYPNLAEKFRWGLHLADCIFVSSTYQQDYWLATAPVKVIPEFFEYDSINEISRPHMDPLVIYLSSNSADQEPTLNLLINLINDNFDNAKFLTFDKVNSIIGISPLLTSSDLPPGNSMNWNSLLSIINFGIFWDTQFYRGIYYRNILEFMGARIPWFLNDSKGYQGLSKYGLIMDSTKNWQTYFLDILKRSSQKIKETEDGFIYAIGHNIDDHIHEILSTFSEIIRSPS